MELLIVDDDFGSRNGMAMTLAVAYPDAALHQAASVREAIARLTEHPQIGLVLVDLNVDDSRGLGTLRALKGWCEHHETNPRLVVVSAAADYDVGVIADALDECATGFIAKGVSEAAFLGAIAQTLAGRIVVSRRGGGGLVPAASRRLPARADPRFTPTEIRVGSLLVQGCSYKQIARKLSSPGHEMVDETVRSHVQNMSWKVRSSFSEVSDLLPAKASVVSAFASGLISFAEPG